MSFWKGLVDKVTQKKEELEDEAKKRAAKKAAEMALDTGKAAAMAAVKNAGKTLDYAGKKLEEALFGPAAEQEQAPDSSKGAPDPFAKLKAEEAARKAAKKSGEADAHASDDRRKVRETEEKDAARAREEARAKTEREVDDELAALKKKIRGK
jgi:hypothetical protein